VNRADNVVDSDVSNPNGSISAQTFRCRHIQGDWLLVLHFRPHVQVGSVSPTYLCFG
jgi:hypothetical protein